MPKEGTPITVAEAWESCFSIATDRLNVLLASKSLPLLPQIAAALPARPFGDAATIFFRCYSDLRLAQARAQIIPPALDFVPMPWPFARFQDQWSFDGWFAALSGCDWNYDQWHGEIFIPATRDWRLIRKHFIEMSTKSAPRRRKWTLSEAEEIVMPILIHAQSVGLTMSVRDIQLKTSIPKTTIQRTQAWKGLGSDARPTTIRSSDVVANAIAKGHLRDSSR